MADGNVNEATSDAELDRIIARYLAQIDSGELVDQESFIAEHPNYAAALGEYFRDVAVVEQLANPDHDWGDNTIVDHSRTTPPAESEPDHQTLVRGNADSQTSIRPDGAQPQAASTIEGEFGRYRILKTLGQGGMGAVYLAHDTQLDRQVALKIPKFEDDLADEMLERFYREARAAAMLRSPNICPVHDVGEIDGQHYITMAYIEGRPLKDYATSKKRHSDRQIAVTIRKLATSLCEAHAAGVIHRDLKPANIMIDQKNEPVVMDFGLARRNAAAEVEVTRSGAILGTPAYMSPEQVEGEQSDIGPQADVYSLGVIMYQLLTGTLPFQGTLMGILKQIAFDEPQPPSELRKGLDSTIEGICLKMMAKDRAERYQSMDDVARDLSNYLKSPPKSKSSGTETTDNETTEDSSRIGEESNPALRTTPPPAKPVAEIPQVTPTPKQSAPAKRSQSLAGEQRSPLNRKIVIAVAALAACGLLYGAITLFLRVGEVDVKVVIDDPSIYVHFEEGDVVRFEGSGKPIRLSPGKQKFVIRRDGLKAETHEFQVKKNSANVLHVTLINGKVVWNNKNVNRKPPEPTNVETVPESDARIARMLLNQGAELLIDVMGKTRIKQADQLPESSFRITSVILMHKKDLTEQHFIQFSRLDKLKILQLSQSVFRIAWMSHLSRANTLQNLDISDTVVEDEGMAFIGRIPNLINLYLRHTKVSNEGLKSLFSLKQLLVLDLTDTRIDDAGLATLKNAFPELLDLRLNLTRITDVGLADLTNRKKLTDLELIGTFIGDEGLGQIQKIRSLEYLRLSNTQISNQGLQTLQSLPRLQTLHLNQTNISDPGLQHLHAIKTLRVIYLEGTKVTAPGVAELKKKLPTCKVIWDGDERASLPLTPGRWLSLLADENEFAKWDVKRGDEKSVTFANGELTMRAVGKFVRGLTVTRDIAVDRLIVHAEHNKRDSHTALRFDFDSIWYSPIHFHQHSHELWKGYTNRTETERVASASLKNDAGYEKWGRFDYVVLDGKMTAYANSKKLYSAPIENNPLTMLRIVGSNSTTRWRNLGILQLTDKQANEVRAGQLPEFPAAAPSQP